MNTNETDHPLKRFVSEMQQVVPAVAVWAHGSLALGDFQPGRSDLDLIAVVGEPLTMEEKKALAHIHRRLAAEEPAAAKLHCSYMVKAELGEVGADHVTWAHRTLYARTVSPVTRQELLTGGLTLHGPAPSDLLPPLAHGELQRFVRHDLESYWLPATGRPWRWLKDPWVDLGLLVLARADATLRDGRLITKREALTDLAALGAPEDVVRDIHDRRYGDPAPITLRQRVRRGMRARAFVRRGIERTLAGAETPE
ncbi:nucleotidyltransferase domain-containing protein [Streptomyces sp. NPDC016845]|uniref:nucleotidyltransferase domain-containing protein n=1 Tax=Streptomyces sp. NPDC016845 TaxID=3364972 RepID=UPI003789A7AC